jgi:iron(III) transport system ATP-binding protein
MTPTAPSGAALQLDDVRIAYDGARGPRTVVDGFTLALDAGRIACLLGPSGCGKTTVLRAIAGFEPVRAGTIGLGGRTLSSTSFHLPPEQRRVGMMFQEYALFPHLTAAQNIAFGLRRVPRAAQRSRVEELLALVGLPEAGERHPHELSGGQQQRIALARALAPSPALLLLDEPFSNLDGATRERLGMEVRTILRAAGQTALLVTHNQSEAHAMADRIGTMHNGRLARWEETPDEQVAPHAPKMPTPSSSSAPRTFP